MSKEKKNQQGANLEAALEQSFIEKNLKLIGIVCAVIAVVVFGCIGVNYYLDSRNAKAAEDLFPCEQLFAKGEFEKALNGDGQSCIGLVAVADQYSWTKTGNLAKLYAGLAYINLEKYEEAKNYLEDFSAKGDAMVSPAALGALGDTYVELGETEKGAETIVKAADKADNAVLTPLFLVKAGELYESLGNKDKALELYKRVKENYRSSAQGQEIDKYIERIEIAK